MELGRRHTTLSESDLEHLRNLVGSWSLLADLSFSDLLLLAPVSAGHAGASDTERFIVLAQVRPTTSQTLYVDDQVGRFIGSAERPLLSKAFAGFDVLEDQLLLPGTTSRVRVQAIPVQRDGQTIAVISSESPRLDSREAGDLENHYLEVYDDLVHMVASGSFPYRYEQMGGANLPRVGDGALVVDASGCVTYSSPNAVSALHRVGFHGNAQGQLLSDVGVSRDEITTALRLRVPFETELQRGTVVIYMRILPLLTDGEVTGLFALMRDVSDLRSRERLVVSMDATIREIHHRVKNNLQTVSSLLRLQSRRVEADESREALEEAIRRVRSIALVHEMLAQGGGDEVNFGEVMRPIVRLAEEALVTPDRPVTFVMSGEGPVLPTSTASSLAVMLNELLQNAVEHGYPPGSGGGIVSVQLSALGRDLGVIVRDYGVGLPEGFDNARSAGLGLTIISTLMTGDLGGTIEVRPAREGEGTEAELRVSF